MLPGIDYFQVVFTLPDQLSGLILGNRRALYETGRLSKVLSPVTGEKGGHGIYSVDQNTLTLCLTNDETARPRAFRADKTTSICCLYFGGKETDVEWTNAVRMPQNQ